MTNVCKQCGASLPIRKKGKNNKNFCSQKCFNAWLRANRIMNCKCAYCGKPIHRKPYRLKRCKHGITCSKECNNKYRSIWFSGKNNHQYGLVGELNASFKSHQHKTVYGYITEEAPGHPFPQDKYDGVTHVLQHRLIVEQNYKMFDPDAFVIINGKHYLKQEYIVHHINKNKADN